MLKVVDSLWCSPGVEISYDPSVVGLCVAMNRGFMRTPLKKTAQKKGRDAQIEEFEKRDLGSDIRASGVRPVVLRPKGQPTSILLEPELVEQLREKGSKRGLGYQTMLKLIVREHLHEY
jgi:hypothetical protein